MATAAEPADQKINPGGFTDPMLPTKFGNWTVCAATVIGKRSNQEDRFVYNPTLLSDEYAFFGVFDGTVKEHASEWVHKHILPIFLKCPSFVAFHKLTASQKAVAKNQDLLGNALAECYAETDKQLIKFCAEKQYHYASCTSVTMVIHKPNSVMYTAHLGDSHCVLGSHKTATSELIGRSLTPVHRPDDPSERERIESKGGSLVYLHGGKPFIRGGDFTQRQHAMQLNYSRAFGGKDLKMYGLSAVPDITRTVLRLRKAAEQKSADGAAAAALAPSDAKSASTDDGIEDVCIMLGSDGLWDVVNPTQGVYVAMTTQAQYAKALADVQKLPGGAGKRPSVQDPGETLVRLALSNHEKSGSNDNVTALVLFL